ncbi:iron-containing alcohol dehydrogenase, partial [Bacillus inaquosorum]|nr:iron-containing alcohol dehydrogenase [Bacillus inaquosorum]
WMRHTLSENPARMKQLAVRVFDVEEAGKTDEEIALEGIDKLSAFWTSLGAPNRLADYDINDEQLDTIADKAMANGTFGQFKSLNKEDVLAILKASL